MSGIVENSVCIQIAFVVRDLKATTKKWEEFLGRPADKLDNSDPYEVSQAEHLGKPMKEAAVTQSLFRVGPNIILEFMQPNGKPSEWQAHLDEHGEGIHHIAFESMDPEKTIEDFESAGYQMTQRGQMLNGSGWYLYFDTKKDLKTTIEMLYFKDGWEKVNKDFPG